MFLYLISLSCEIFVNFTEMCFSYVIYLLHPALHCHIFVTVECICIQHNIVRLLLFSCCNDVVMTSFEML